MDLGRVVTTGPPDEVVNDPRVVAAYLGMPPVAVYEVASFCVEKSLCQLSRHSKPSYQVHRRGGNVPLRPLRSGNS